LTFQDLVVLKKAAALVRARVSPYRVRRAFKSLKAQFPGRPLSGLSLHTEGSSILVREDEAVWNSLSGQLLLDFEGTEARAPAILHARAAPSHEEGEAMRLYEEACDLETTDEARALALYERVLSLAPGHVEGLINLARLRHSKGELHAAERGYRKVLEAGPHHPIAAFNFAVLLEDLERPEEAIRWYLAALAVDPSCADAHFNIARLYERKGDRRSALRHLQAFRRLSHPAPAEKS
jgi:tetratricopeptide (TPR) repeat protein